jgi:RNA polymerase subunit RPABC4/transcription elongation factor Spt4
MGCGVSCEFGGEVRFCLRCKRELFFRSDNNLCQICEPSKTFSYTSLIGGRCNTCHTKFSYEPHKRFCNSGCRDEFLKKPKCKICLQVVNFDTKQCPKCLTKIASDYSNVFFKEDLARLAGVNLCKYCSQVFSKSSFNQEFCGSKCQTANNRSHYNPSECGFPNVLQLKQAPSWHRSFQPPHNPKPDPPKCPPISNSTSTTKPVKKYKIIVQNRNGRTIYTKKKKKYY